MNNPDTVQQPQEAGLGRLEFQRHHRVLLGLGLAIFFIAQLVYIQNVLGLGGYWLQYIICVLILTGSLLTPAGRGVWTFPAEDPSSHLSAVLRWVLCTAACFAS